MAPSQVPSKETGVVIRRQVIQSETVISPGQNWSLKTAIENGFLELSFPAGTFAGDQSLVSRVNECFEKCSEEESYGTLKLSRISQVLTLSPLPFPSKYVRIRLPFDSKSPLITNPGEIKIGTSYLSLTGINYVEFHEPIEINIELGFAEFQHTEGETYWVAQPIQYNNSSLTFSNSDLLPGLVPNSGFRTFFANVGTGSTYELRGATGASLSGFNVNCDTGFAGSTSTLPFTITGLTSGVNKCQVWSYFWGDSRLSGKDLIVIRKN